MTIGVYFIQPGHTRSDLFFDATERQDSPERTQARIDLAKVVGAYKLVAQLNHLDYQSDLEDAWAATQNIHDAWVMADTVSQCDPETGIEMSMKEGIRSSMVGDIFIQNGEAYMVAGMGFEKLPEAATRALLAHA